jgi:iron complex transport system ATP-binding protein
MKLSGHDLAIGYRDRIVGRHLDIALATGEVLALLGPNGGGKTTLLKTLLGLLVPRSGEVRLNDRPLPDYSSRARARLIAYVPQVEPRAWFQKRENAVRRGLGLAQPYSGPGHDDQSVNLNSAGRFGADRPAARCTACRISARSASRPFLSSMARFITTPIGQSWIS